MDVFNLFEVLRYGMGSDEWRGLNEVRGRERNGMLGRPSPWAFIEQPVLDAWSTLGAKRPAMGKIETMALEEDET